MASRQGQRLSRRPLAPPPLDPFLPGGGDHTAQVLLGHLRPVVPLPLFGRQVCHPRYLERRPEGFLVQRRGGSPRSYEVRAEHTHQGQHGWVRDVAIPSAAGNKTFVYVVAGTHGRPPLFVLEVGDFNDANAFRDQIRPLAQDAPALHLVGFAADSRPLGTRSPCTAAL